MKEKLPDISAGILSGGRSSRMGQDKALIRIGNERIIEKLSRELSVFPEVLVSAGENSSYEALGLPVVYDEHRNIGPMEGLYQILKHAAGDYVFICAADMPEITGDIAVYISGYISSDYDCYVIADDDHIQPLCAVYSKRVLPVIEELIASGKYRLREIFSRVRTKYISLEFTCFDKNTVRNINTREDLRELAKPFVFCVSGYSDSGKTGLIERLINEFITDGWSVGVIKHDGHDCFTDVRGADTERFITAGAAATAVFSDNRYAMHFGEGTDMGSLIDRMMDMKAPPDAVIIEGMKNSAFPKIEIVRRGISEKSVCDEASLICIATDFLSPDSVICPVYGLDDTRGIFLCLKEYFDTDFWRPNHTLRGISE